MLVHPLLTKHPLPSSQHYSMRVQKGKPILQLILSTSGYYFNSVQLTFVLNSSVNGNRLLLCVTPTKNMLSEISQTYLLRAKAVALDWRVPLLVEMMSKRPWSNDSFSSSGITLYIFLANTMIMGHLAFKRKWSISFSNLLLKPLTTQPSCSPAAQS